MGVINKYITSGDERAIASFFFLENISFQKTKNAWSYISHKN